MNLPYEFIQLYGKCIYSGAPCFHVFTMFSGMPNITPLTVFISFINRTCTEDNARSNMSVKESHLLDVDQ